MFRSAYTKEQILRMLPDWNAADQKLPTKKTKILVALPPPAILNQIEVTLSPDKSTYGKTLYNVVMTSDAERASVKTPVLGNS